MAKNSRPVLVQYRRNSSDMDMSSSDEEETKEIEVQNVEKKMPTYTHDPGKRDNGQSSRDERLSEVPSDRDDRIDNSRPDSYGKSRDRRDKRKEDETRRHHGGDRHRDSPDRVRENRSRYSPSRDYHHRHRSRSPVRKHSPRRSRSPNRHKHSPPRRDADRRSRKKSHSPERSRGKYPDNFRSRRLERKAARIDKLGIELVAEPKDGFHQFPNMSSSAKDIEAKTGVAFPNYYNPGVMNPAKYAQQIQKRKLLWGAKKETVVEPSGEQPGGSGVKWTAATFKGDNDGRVTEKFKRLMGIKDDSAAGDSKDSEIIDKQEEMFSNMEAQYQVARMATHTHRGIGLGFGTFQVPPQ